MSTETLSTELEKERSNIKTDTYPMSIGEIMNLYKDKELILNPAFQRLFRWKDKQKTKFIESILLGIPIPPIFVAQQKSGVWSIVDGLQRLSTILQLTGDLVNKKPLVLTSTKLLPSLEGETWETLDIDIKRIFKRSKLGINIILTENSIQAQYELFQRLNTGGLHLAPQEIRNCLIIMLKPDFYEKINDLKNDQNFLDCIKLNQEKLKQEFHMELILRYFIAKHNIVNYDNYQAWNTIIGDFYDKETTALIEDENFDLDKEIVTFKEVFLFLNEKLKSNIFRKFNHDNERYQGGFSDSAYEAIVSGLSLNLVNFKNIDNDIFETKIKQMYNEEGFTSNSVSGTKALNRFKGLTQFSKEYFSNVNE